jgi:hypothetical protein
MLVVANWHHFEEEQDPEPDPALSDTVMRFRIRMKVTRRICTAILVLKVH